MHAVFKTSTDTNVTPWMIAVTSLAYSLHYQVTYHVQKYNSLQNTIIHLAVWWLNYHIHSTNILNDSSLTLYMLAHAMTNSTYTCTIHSNCSTSLTTTYHTIHEEWQVIMPPNSNPDSMGFAWPHLKWLYQPRIFHRRKYSSYRVQGVPRPASQISLQAFYSIFLRIVAITVWIYCLTQSRLK